MKISRKKGCGTTKTTFSLMHLQRCKSAYILFISLPKPCRFVFSISPYRFIIITILPRVKNPLGLHVTNYDLQPQLITLLIKTMRHGLGFDPLRNWWTYHLASVNNDASTLHTFFQLRRKKNCYKMLFKDTQYCIYKYNLIIHI